MKWIQVTAAFSGNDPDLAEELVTDIFLQQGLKGVVCEVPLPPPDDGFSYDDLPVPDQPAITGFLPDTDASLAPLEAIRKGGASLAAAGITVTFTTRTVDQESWADAWKKFFFVTRITDRIVIKPTWREFTPQKNDRVIHMDPGMAFGTGTHPTTSMCIALIEKILQPRQCLLDVGTGSGILMIAAALCGASAMTGIDTDEVAIRVARENLEKNHIPPACYRLVHGVLTPGTAPAGHTFDVVVANIIAEVIVDILPDLIFHLAQSGTLILSGIIQEKKKRVTTALQQAGLFVTEVQETDEWVALTATPR